MFSQQGNFLADIRQINDFIWEIERSGSMSVPVRIFGNSNIAASIKKDRTLLQAVNATSLPGIIRRMCVMPDGHEGYGFPVGGVAAFDAEEGIISPGAIGFDINCGVRLIKTNLKANEIKKELPKLMDNLFKNVPSGVGSKNNLGLSQNELNRVAEEGAGYLIDKGYGFNEDLELIEEKGCMDGADSSKVSTLAKKRGINQLGTLGAGNHFLEVQKVEHILDKGTAEGFGLFEGQVVVMVHTGSRGYGHQICSDYIEKLIQYQKDNKIELSDPQLSYVFTKSKEAEEYLSAMRSAVNFAFSNRQIITCQIRKSFEETFGKSSDALGMNILYDVAHNIAKLEEHTVEGKRRKMYVHRKGATRAFGPSRKEVPKTYRGLGQPVIIPGSMGTASYVLSGRDESSDESFGSSCHGSGRTMSRHQAIRDIPASKTISDLKSKGIEFRVRSTKLISEEAIWAYKDVDDVVSSVEGAKISTTVARMAPMGVAKG